LATQLAAAVIDAFGVVAFFAAAQLFPSDPITELTKYRLAPLRSGRIAIPSPPTPSPIDVS
jgi:hypothetical protein